MAEFKALKAKEDNSELLLKYPNVVGTGVGLKEIEGVKESAVVVFVEEKLTQQQVISKYSSADIIPSSLQGVPTKIIEVGKISKQNFRGRVRPIQPGFSAGHASITTGTIGGFFRDKDGDIVALSNNHVFAAENKARLNDPIYQPGPIDASAGSIRFNNWPQPVANLPYFATLKKFLALNRSNNLHDSAIAKVHQTYLEGNLLDLNYPGIQKPIVGFSGAAINMDVQKCGRTTGYTRGRVLALHGSFTINYDFGPARFNDCIVITGMSQGGDSGSLILDNNMNGVGLLFAGSDKVTLANPIQYVIAEYGLSIYNKDIRSQKADKKDWRLYSTSGTIEGTENTLRLKANKDTCCFVEKNLSDANQISILVNIENDSDDIYGPSIALLSDDNFVKITASIHGFTLSDKENIYRSEHKAALETEYLLRAKKENDNWICDFYDGTKFVNLGKIRLEHAVNKIRVGKMDRQAAISQGATSDIAVHNFYHDIKIS